MENPGYPGAADAFLQAGARLVPVPVDEVGYAATRPAAIKAGIERLARALD